MQPERSASGRRRRAPVERTGGQRARLGRAQGREKALGESDPPHQGGRSSYLSALRRSDEDHLLHYRTADHSSHSPVDAAERHSPGGSLHPPPTARPAGEPARTPTASGCTAALDGFQPVFSTSGTAEAPEKRIKSARTTADARFAAFGPNENSYPSIPRRRQPGPARCSSIFPRSSAPCGASDATEPLAKEHS